ncbi:MAG: hypothetical protein ACP5G8_03455 [Athalassotoga sp.]
MQKLDTSADTLGTILTLGADSAYFIGAGNGYAVIYMMIEGNFAGIKIIRLSDMTVVASVSGSQTNASEYNGVIDVVDGTSTVLEYSESDWTATQKTFSQNVVAIQKYDGGYIIGTDTKEIYDNTTLLGTANNAIVKVLKEPNAVSAITQGEYVYFESSTTTDHSLDIPLSVGTAQAPADHEINVSTVVKAIQDNTLFENSDVKVLKSFSIDKSLEIKTNTDHEINADLETRIEKYTTLLSNLSLSVKNENQKDVSMSVNVLKDATKDISVEIRDLNEYYKNISMLVAVGKNGVIDEPLNISIIKDNLQTSVLEVRTVKDTVKSVSIIITVEKSLEIPVSIAVANSLNSALNIAVNKENTLNVPVNVRTNTNQVKDLNLELSVQNDISASTNIDVYHSIAIPVVIDVKVYKPTLYFNLSIDAPSYLEKGSTLIVKTTVRDEDGYLSDLDNCEIILTEKATRIRRGGYLIDHSQRKYILGVQTLDCNAGRHFVVVKGTLGQVLQEAYSTVDIQDHE